MAYLDTGAAANLSGDAVLLDHERRVFDVSKDSIQAIIKQPEVASFAGIDGPGSTTWEAWSAPIFMGGGMGAGNYRASVIPGSNLPSLLCLMAMGEKESVIHCGSDSFYIPVQPGQNVYHKLALDWDGCHYSLPIGKWGPESTPSPVHATYFCQEPVMQKMPDGGQIARMDFRQREVSAEKPLPLATEKKPEPPTPVVGVPVASVPAASKPVDQIR